jgi:hypothetical protein
MSSVRPARPRDRKLRIDGVPSEGPGGLVDSLRLVGSEPEGRALLRAYKLDAAQGAERAPMPFKR